MFKTAVVTSTNVNKESINKNNKMQHNYNISQKKIKQWYTNVTQLTN